MSEFATAMSPAAGEGDVRVDTMVVGAEKWFFFLEIDVLEQSHDWSRDAFALYLLHCRGYNPKSAGSTFGEKGCKGLIGLTRKPWGLWTKWLEAHGLIRTAVHGIRPVTLLSSAKWRFTTSFQPIVTDYRRYDGHVWENLIAEDAELVKIPWRAMDIDRMNPEARVGVLRELDSIRLLVWAYSVAHDDGWVSSSLLWLDSADAVVGRLAQDVRERLHLQAEQVGRAVDELLVCGLLRHSECDNKGRGVLYLAHPMELPDMDREGREEEAA